ncbi:MAG: cell division protein FtsA [Alistipes sp.]|nr:cell division protein FtsA [Alistipes sp.]
MEKRLYTVAVDLGTTNVVVIVGWKNDDGTIHVDKLVSRPCEGLSAGEIENIASAGNSIRAALSEVEVSLGFRVSEVYAGISGRFIRCDSYTDHVFTADSQSGVSSQDVEALYERMAGVKASDDEIILESIPQNFMVDDRREVKNPVGSFGKRLSSTFKFILCEPTPLDRLQRVFAGLNIKLLGIYPTMLTIVDSIVTPDEREEGVAIVDLGGGKTDVTVVYKNIIRYVASIPMGGQTINSDIYSLGVPEKYVERLKVKHGSAVAEMTERKLLQIPGGRSRDVKGLLSYNLAAAIEGRMMDIIELVKGELRESGFGDKLSYGIVLAGGGSRLANVAELFRRETGMDVRLSETDSINKNKPDMPPYATALGVLMRGLADGKSTLLSSQQHQQPRPETQHVEPERPMRTASVQPAATAPVQPETGTAAKPAPAAPSASDAPASKPEPAPQQPMSPYGLRTRIHGQTIEEAKAEAVVDDEAAERRKATEERRGGFLKSIFGKMQNFVDQSFENGGDEDTNF